VTPKLSSVMGRGCKAVYMTPLIVLDWLHLRATSREHPFVNEKLIERITQYLNKDQPLGPTDAHQIKDAEVAASLFDPHNEAFNLLLRRNISVVIGRRGSGKTALLNSYLYRPFLPKNILANESGNVELDLNDYSIVIDILGYRLFERMQEHVAGQSGVLRPIESVIEDWADLLTDYVILKIWESERERADQDENIKIMATYIDAPETRKKAEAYRLIWGQGFFDTIKAFLTRSGTSSPNLPTHWVCPPKFFPRFRERPQIH
jgi:hypothetical protein